MTTCTGACASSPNSRRPGIFSSAVAHSVRRWSRSRRPPDARPSGPAVTICPTRSTDAELVWDVTLAAVGGHVTQGRAVGSVEGREILTVNAALGKDELAVGGVWVVPPDVPPPDQCPPRFLPELFRNTIMDSVEVRSAKGRTFEELDGSPGSPDSALWARVPGHLTPSAATLAIFGDYVSGAVSQPLGRHAMGRSLDNTLRMVQVKPTEWVLCDIRIHAVVGGYGQGIAYLWSEDGDLLATASQSIGVRLWPEGAELPR